MFWVCVYHSKVISMDAAFLLLPLKFLSMEGKVGEHLIKINKYKPGQFNITIKSEV